MSLEPHAPEIAEHAEQHGDDDACRELLRTVLERTVMDMQYLRRFEGCTKLQKHELERVRRINANPPDSFLEGSWFVEICGHLGVDPVKIRRRLESAA